MWYILHGLKRLLAQSAYYREIPQRYHQLTDCAAWKQVRTLKLSPTSEDYQGLLDPKNPYPLIWSERDFLWLGFIINLVRKIPFRVGLLGGEPTARSPSGLGYGTAIAMALIWEFHSVTERPPLQIISCNSSTLHGCSAQSRLKEDTWVQTIRAPLISDQWLQHELRVFNCMS